MSIRWMILNGEKARRSETMDVVGLRLRRHRSIYEVNAIDEHTTTLYDPAISRYYYTKNEFATILSRRKL